VNEQKGHMRYSLDVRTQHLHRVWTLTAAWQRREDRQFRRLRHQFLQNAGWDIWQELVQSPDRNFYLGGSASSG